MDYLRSNPSTQPEHLSIAIQFADEMTTRYNPEEQNELLIAIKNHFKERRELEIKELTERVKRLESCYSFLANIQPLNTHQ